MKKTPRFYFILQISLLTFFVLSSCNENNGKKQVSKIFHYNESKNISTLDPAFARNQATIWPINQIFNGLIQLDDSLNIKPCIAKSWNISDDGKVYIFHLRKDVYFHDNIFFSKSKGRKVIASDFEYSFNRLIDEKVASPGMWVFNSVDKIYKNSNNGFKAINDSTFAIYLKSPFPAFLGILTTPYCFVVPKEVVEHYGRDFRSHPVGTGPFMFKLWVDGEKLVLVKNPNYFEKDNKGICLPRIDAVSITFIADKQSEFLEFIKGRIDFISGVNASFKDELITKNGQLQPKYKNELKMLVCPYLNTEYIGILAEKSNKTIANSPVRDKNIRLAMNLAINKQKMIAYLRNNIGFPANSGFIPKGMPGFSEKLVHGYMYNPDSARKLLEIAGYQNGKGLKTIKIVTVSDYLDICEFVQHELNQVGINIEIEVVTGLSYREMLANNRMEMFRASWIADYADAENYLSLFYSKNFSPNGPNYTHFKNIEFDKLYEQALTEKDNLKRMVYYNKMDQIIINEANVIPLFYDVAIRFTHNWVYDLGINPLNLLNLKYVKIEKK